MPRASDSSLARLVLPLVLLVSQPALAQSKPGGGAPPPSPAAPVTGKPLGESLTGAAKVEYAAAKILYEDGDYKGALLKLKTAYELSHDPRLFWNMAACEKNLRRYAEVARLVERYMADGGALLSERDRSDARELLQTVKGFITKLTVTVDQPGATIRMDGEELGISPLPAPVHVDMGRHEFRVTKPGFVEHASTHELTGGQPHRIDVRLVAERHEGRLRIVAGASDVIQIDRKVSKVGLWEGTLPSGTHSVLVTGKGKLPHQTDVIVQDNDLTNLHVTLEAEPTTASAERTGIPTWVWIAGGAVLLGGGVGGYFLLKPENRTNYKSPSEGNWDSIYF